MRGYRSLYEVFPFCLQVPAEDAEAAAKVLIAEGPMKEGDGHCSHGSSFAVTADTDGEGTRCLWLSAVSMRRLNDIGFFVREDSDGNTRTDR